MRLGVVGKGLLNSSSISEAVVNGIRTVLIAAENLVQNGLREKFWLMGVKNLEAGSFRHGWIQAWKGFH